MNSQKTNYFRRLRNKEYRDSVVETAIGDTIATQLQALRNKNGLNQTQLAKKANMAQPRIAVLENPDYDKYTVNTLKRLASALDVGLIIRFAPYGEVMDWVSGFSPDSINIPTYEEELKLSQGGGGAAEAVIDVTMDIHPPVTLDKANIKSESETDSILLIQGI